jgi:hypothetical protein
MSDPNDKETLQQADDHDILVGLGVDMIWLKKQFSNHLEHHKLYEKALLVAIILAAMDRIFLS